tara:strand:- start:13264 stop:13743 length:480 start_codon:yes stop_codon:yes gene_type:complete
MSAQLSYSTNLRKAFAGMLADLHNHDIISRSIETVAGADFGIAVSRGTEKDKQAVIGGATGFLGITVRSLGRENTSNDTVKYSKTETAGILRQGYIYVVCPSGCNPGDPVNYIDATGILDSGAAVAGETNLTGAIWDTTAAAGELAVIRLAGISTTAGA